MFAFFMVRRVMLRRVILGCIMLWSIGCRSVWLRRVWCRSIGLGRVRCRSVGFGRVWFGLRGIPYLLNHIDCSRANLVVPSGILHFIRRSFEIVVFKRINGLFKTGEL